MTDALRGDLAGKADLASLRADLDKARRSDADVVILEGILVLHDEAARAMMDLKVFVHVDPDSRRVKGHEDIFVVGDAADFPIKRAFLALLQNRTAPLFAWCSGFRRGAVVHGAHRA